MEGWRSEPVKTNSPHTLKHCEWGFRWSPVYAVCGEYSTQPCVQTQTKLITHYNIINTHTTVAGLFYLIIELLSVHADVQLLLFSETSKCNELYKSEMRLHLVSIQNYNVQSFYLMMNSSLRRGVMWLASTNFSGSKLFFLLFINTRWTCVI